MQGSIGGSVGQHRGQCKAMQVSTGQCKGQGSAAQGSVGLQLLLFGLPQLLDDELLKPK